MKHEVHAGDYEGPDRRARSWLDTRVNIPTLITVGLLALTGLKGYVDLEHQVDDNTDDIVDLRNAEKRMVELDKNVATNSQQIAELRVQASRQDERVDKQLRDISAKLDKLTDYLLRNGARER